MEESSDPTLPINQTARVSIWIKFSSSCGWKPFFSSKYTQTLTEPVKDLKRGSAARLLTCCSSMHTLNMDLLTMNHGT